MIKFFFTYDNTMVMLPVNPKELKIVKGGANTVENIVGLGQVNLLDQPGLATIEIVSFFPTDKNAPYVNSSGGIHEPSYYIHFFDRIRKEKKPVEFSISGMDGNLIEPKPLVTVENFTYSREAGDPDVNYVLGLKEYRSFESRALEVNLSSTDTVSSEPVREVTKSVPKTYTVASGDSLWEIARKHLGNGTRYMEIVSLNQDQISNPNLIYPGQVLVLPE